MDELAARQGAGVIVVKPTTAFLTAFAALNWIAFQQAEEGDLTGYHYLWREFGYQPKRPPDFSAFDYAVAEAANRLSSGQRAHMAECVARIGKEPREMLPAREAAARVLADRGWRAVELFIYLQARRDQWAQRSDRFLAAQGELIEALAAERLTAWASRAAAAVPEQGQYSTYAIASADAIPWKFFLTRDAVVHATGAITARADPGYLDARFRTQEILALWPTSEAERAESADRVLATAPEDAAVRWMDLHVTEPGTWKRDAAIERCSRETGATYRASQAAWNSLSDEIRGKRGVRK